MTRTDIGRNSSVAEIFGLPGPLRRSGFIIVACLIASLFVLSSGRSALALHQSPKCSYVEHSHMYSALQWNGSPRYGRVFSADELAFVRGMLNQAGQQREAHQ